MTSRVFPTFTRDFLGLAVLVAGALTVGAVANNFRKAPLALVYATKAARLDQAVTRVAATTPVMPAPEPTHSAVLAPPPPAPEAKVYDIELAVFQQRLGEPGAVVLDARPEIFHRFGHIPGALPLPRDEFEEYYPKHKARLEAYKDKEVLIYCQGSSCEDSHLVASALTKLGYMRLAIFAGGWNAWTQQGLPQEK